MNEMENTKKPPFLCLHRNLKKFAFWITGQQEQLRPALTYKWFSMRQCKT